MIKAICDKAGTYCWNILIGLDQLLNVVLFGCPDETFSARTFRRALAGRIFWRFLNWGIDGLFFWQKEHCRAAWQSERERRHAPAGDYL